MSRGTFLSLLHGYYVFVRPLARMTRGSAETTGAVMWEIAEMDQETAKQVKAAFHRMAQIHWLREQLGMQVVEGAMQ